MRLMLIFPNTTIPIIHLSVCYSVLGLLSNNKVKVNFGTEDTMTCSVKSLNEIDTSKCKTVSLQKFRNRMLDDKGNLNRVIVGNELKEYVGIGWVTLRAVTHGDLQKYPRVI